MLTYKELKDKIEKSGAILDKKCPGWWKKISIRKLDMDMGNLCIIGQIKKAGLVKDAEYDDWSWSYDMNSEMAFYIYSHTKTEFPASEKMKILTKLWKSYIKWRRNERNS